MAQSVERRIGSAEVTGPIPVSSFYKSSNHKNSNPCICKDSSFFGSIGKFLYRKVLKYFLKENIILDSQVPNVGFGEWPRIPGW